MSDLSDLVSFSDIQSEADAKQCLDLFIDVSGASKGKQFSKEKCKEFLQMMQIHLESKQATPNSKYHTLYMLKMIIDRWQAKILSVLVAHSLLKYMSRMAKEIDPNKPLTQKGKSLFKDKQLGNNYIRLLLECLKMMSQKSKSSSSEPTKFRKYYSELEEMKITLPKEYKFFADSKMKKSPSAQEVGSTHKSRDSIQNTKEPTPKQASTINYKKSIEITLNKISTLVETLNTEEDEQSFRQMCQNLHKVFLNDKEKYQKILETQENVNETDFQQIWLLNDFLNQQNDTYLKHVLNQKDYESYRREMLEIADKFYRSQGGEGVPETEPKMEERPFMKAQMPSGGSRKNNFAKDTGESNSALITKLKSQLQQKSKNANIGFKSIKQSLSKDKSLGRTKRSVSGFKKSYVTQFGKSMSKSKIAQTFDSPPNMYPRDKRYDGDLIEQNKQLGKVMKQLTKKQGIRRFITCNFKQKNPLFENTHIQIGVKSEPVYESINDFKVLIGIELYIGNKTDEMIKNMSINYKGNQEVLLYGNPRTVDSVLLGGYQLKHELLIVPLSYQFPLIKMLLKYSINNETFFQNITLPNTILKLAHHGQMDKKQFIQNWNESTIYRTSEFKWTRHIAPDSLSKYIKTLAEFTPYQKFIVPGSEIDYELGCHVILKQRYEGVLRICIRPNFNAVIQVGVLESSEQAVESFIFYLQTLQALLTHVEHEEL